MSFVSLQAAVVAALSSGLCGYLSRPAAAVAPCICRCIADPDEARLGDHSKFGRDTHQPAFSSSFDLPISGVVLGFVLGVTFAVAVAKFWNCLIVALSQALEPQPSLRRPSALAP